MLLELLSLRDAGRLGVGKTRLSHPFPSIELEFESIPGGRDRLQRIPGGFRYGPASTLQANRKKALTSRIPFRVGEGGAGQRRLDSPTGGTGVSEKRARRERSKPSDNQAIQRRLVEEAMKIPGVAEAVDAYGALQRHGMPYLRPGATKVRYAAGGNS